MRRITVLLSALLLILGMTGMAAVADEETSPLWNDDNVVETDGLTVTVDPRDIDGDIIHEADGQSIQGETFYRNQTAETLIAVEDLVNDGEDELHLVFDGQRPSDDEFQPGEGICDDLLTGESCTTISEAVGSDNSFTENTTFLDNEELTINPDAETGEWQLRWHVIDAETEEAFFSETFNITIAEEELAASISLTGDVALTVNQTGSYDVQVTNEMEYRDLDEWKLGLSVTNISDIDDITIEWFDTQENEYRDIDDIDQIETAFDSEDGILWVLGADEDDLSPGAKMEDEFQATFHADGTFTGTAYVVDTSS